MKIFKEELVKSKNYIGGKSIEEVAGPGRKIYKLSSNENALGISPKAVEAAQKAASELHIYPDGTPDKLAKAIATSYDNRVSPEQVLIGNSGSEVIEILVRGLLDKGSEYIVANPTFQLYRILGIKMGAEQVDVRLKENWELDIEGIVNSFNDRTRLLYITNPNNPTGTIYSYQELDELFKHVPEGVVIVYDEVYERYVDNDNYSTAMRWLDQGKDIIGINSFSKMYGMAGMRLGYGYTNDKLADYLRKLTRPFMINSIAIAAGIAAINDGAFIEKSVSHVKQEKKYLYAELDRLGVEYWKSESNFIMIRLSERASEFEEFMLAQDVMVRPVGYFGAEGCVRVTIGTEDGNRAYIKGLEKFLAQ